MELARHLEFTVSTSVKVLPLYDPQSPWQREQMRTQMEANSAVLFLKRHILLNILNMN